MNPDTPSSKARSTQAELILCEALAYDSEAEREAFLKKRCAGDPELMKAVTQLLALENDADTFFESDAPSTFSVEELSQTLAELPQLLDEMDSGLPKDDEVGKQIGPYTLLRKIGEGGVGNVYLARQEKPVRRQVALKVIKAGMDTKSVIARFEAERQALAMMEHPNIAHVLNAGQTENGRPFFVMELVHGVRITTYCDDAELDVRQRLRLFIQVCHAIQHAHQKGVIHRDIKPSNVLVAEERYVVPSSGGSSGKPPEGGTTNLIKVIDFGIAKATGENLLSDQTLFTARELLIGTPAYMSPEQAQMGDVDVDTRCDIYSLGVLLYELLTGIPPFAQKQLLNMGLDEMRRTLREVDPPTPSAKFAKMPSEDQLEAVKNRNTDARRLTAMLSGDLNWIVMKALEKDRDRRYESADALAMDVERFLNNEPVLARSPSQGYRLRKLIRRNRATFAYLSAVFLALIIGLGMSSWFLVQERAAKERAVRAEQQQSRLRQAAEDRERIAYAAVLINQNKIEEADQLVDEVATELMPSLEVGSVLRQLGDWNAKLERWSPALKLFTALLKADVMENSDAVSMDLLLAGPVLIWSGDLRGYEAFRRAAIDRHRGTKDGYAAERTLKICLLTPADHALMNQLKAFQNLATENTPLPPTDHLAAWRCISLALMAYRQEDFPAAIEWCRQCRIFNADATSRTATAHIIEGMALDRMNQSAAAADQFGRGRKMIEDWFAVAPEKRTDRTGYWFDWLFARILLQEADSKHEEKPTRQESAVLRRLLRSEDTPNSPI